MKHCQFLPGLVLTLTTLLPALAAGQVSLVQINTNPYLFIYRNSVAVPFTGTQTAGNLNVVVVVNVLAAPEPTISCLTPSFPTGTVSVTVTNVDGQMSAASDFLFTVSTPFASAASTSLTPDAGSTNDGKIVTIYGRDFAAGEK